MGAKHSLPEFDNTAAGKTFLVTGANTGIGYEVAKYLANLGARVVIGCRSEERALQAIQRMTEEIKEEARKEKAKTNEAKKHEGKTVDGKKDGTETAEAKVDEAKTDEAKTDAATTDETKVDEAKADESKADGTKTDEAKTDDAKADEAKTDEAKTDEAKTDEAKTDEAKTDEAKTDEAKTDEAKTDEARTDEVKGEGSKDDAKPLDIQYMHLDLSSFKSTMEFVENYKASGLPLHILICNAGMVARQKTLSVDGFEKVFQVNYLSHFLLTLHLIPLLKKTASHTRVVNVSSQSKLQPILKKINFDDIQGHPFSPMGALSNSKSYQIMNMYSFCKRLKTDGDSKVSIFSVHPGYVNTFIGRDATGGFKKAMATAVNNSGMFISGRIGSLGVLNAALNPELEDKTGIYFRELKESQHASFISDAENQDKLWNHSLSCLKEHLTDEVLQEVGETLENIKPFKKEDGETGSKVKEEEGGAAGEEVQKEEETEKPEKEEEGKKEVDEGKDGGEDNETKEP